MVCGNCNSYNNDGSAHCVTCGASLAGQPPAPGQPHPGQQQPGFQPGYQQPHYPHAVHTRTSGMAIAGFVLSFFCGLLGLIFSIIGYNECKNSNGAVKGEGLALAGIIISICTMVLGLVIALSDQ